MSPWRVRRRLFALCGRSWPTIRALLPRRGDPPVYVDLEERTRQYLAREAEFQANADADVRILRRSYSPAPKGALIPALVVMPCQTPGCPLPSTHKGPCPDARD